MRRTLLWTLLILSIGSEVHAYADPGSGALIWQLGAAAVFGVLFNVRRFIAWLSGQRKETEIPKQPPAGK